MLKIKKETVLQKELIDTCTKLGGFGKKTQDKYIKGQPDLWLKLPSGLIIWAEVKVVRNILYTISVPFMPLQLDSMEQYTLHDIPTLGLTFAITPDGIVYYKISAYHELKKLWEKFNSIRYHISHFKRCHNLEEVIEDIEAYFTGSTAQFAKYKVNGEPKINFYKELV